MLITTTKTYGLTGNVEYVSEKIEKVTLAKDWNYTIDTKEPYCFISNKYFNRNGVVDSVVYLNKDSILLSKVLYNYNNDDNKGIFSIQYNNIGKKIYENICVNQEDSIAYFKTINADNKDIESKSWTKIVNNKTVWQKSENVKSKLISEWIYKIDNNGQDIEIKTKNSFDKKQNINIVKIKYIEYDKCGNWTKRIEFNDSDKNASLVKTRLIKYYE
ncbi:hypothetical protein CLV25_10762 [Acetobacteroides hydrogenigenes]|uniref:Uncharacterized protein n=2 Tax=Acetobacteroides hydrogenigenes TaxID=979970 RepID=A0A4R2EGC5_9BACT|nr:hypothetical protein CLV25_10762 [Acetobacteroides hydrogenigenes]